MKIFEVYSNSEFSSPGDKWFFKTKSLAEKFVRYCKVESPAEDLQIQEVNVNEKIKNVLRSTD